MARTDLLTMDRVGNMTTYELRQEADARGLLKDLRPVNHQTLMKRLVQVIVEEDYERGRQSLQRSADPLRSEVEKERVRKERNERKAAALERSRQRQADKNYFNAKKLLNVKDEGRSVVDTSPSSEQEEDLEVSTINPSPQSVCSMMVDEDRRAKVVQWATHEPHVRSVFTLRGCGPRAIVAYEKAFPLGLQHKKSLNSEHHKRSCTICRKASEG